MADHPNPAIQKVLDDAKAKALANPKPVILRAPPPKVFTKEELESFLLEVPTLHESKDDEVEHAILYGDPGTGKTVQAALLSEFYNLLWFDGDKGLTAVIHNLPSELTKRIRIIKILDNTMTPFMVHTMLKVVTGRQVVICREHGAVDCTICRQDKEAKFATIALNVLPGNWIAIMDSQTQFVASALAQVHYKVNKSALGKDTDDFWRGEGDDVFAYWGSMKNVMDKFGNYMKDLRCKFVTISHETVAEKEDKTSKIIVPVSGSDASSRSYSKFYGTVVHCEKINNQIKYQTQTTGSNRIQAKSRTNVILEKEESPGLIHIFNPKEAKELLKGSYTEWYLREGWKHPSERKSIAPQPKGVLPI